MTDLLINSRPLGPTRPTFVIAEIGVNHDGSVDRALELVNIARTAGADAVKLQVFRARQLMNRAAAFADYQKSRVTDADPAEMLRRYELAGEDLARVVTAISDAGMVPIATPFSPDDVETLRALPLPAVKIASPDLVNKPLLRLAADLGRPLLISTGAATLDEVAESVAWLRDWNCPFALLHCVSSYPTPADQTHLGWIADLARRFDCPVGYSDHSTETLTGALAVAAGACLVERHLTYDNDAVGPDHAASSDPAAFREYVRLVRLADILRGHGHRRVLPIEQDVRTVSRQSLVARRALRAGDVLRASDLTVQRPGTGIPAAAMDSVVGRKLTAPVDAGQMLTWSQLES